MRATSSVRLRLGAAGLLAAWGLSGPAQAHPHGAVQCSARLAFEAGRPHRLEADLLLDRSHSQEAWAVLHDPSSGQMRPGMLQRFAFGLRMQMGRLNWLYRLQADDADVPMQSDADPQLSFEADRLRIRVVFDLPAGATPAATVERWSLQCADPSYYWVTAFGQTAEVERSNAPLSEADPLQVAARLQALPPLTQDPMALEVTGCARRAPQQPMPPARAGQARIDWRCGP